MDARKAKTICTRLAFTREDRCVWTHGELSREKDHDGDEDGFFADHRGLRSERSRHSVSNHVKVTFSG